MKHLHLCMVFLVIAGCNREEPSVYDRSSQLRLGMTRNEVISIMGEPDHIKSYEKALEFTNPETGEKTFREVDEGLCYGRFEFKTDKPEFKDAEGTYFRVECQMWQGRLVGKPFTTNPNDRVSKK